MNKSQFLKAVARLKAAGYRRVVRANDGYIRYMKDTHCFCPIEAVAHHRTGGYYTWRPASRVLKLPEGLAEVVITVADNRKVSRRMLDDEGKEAFRRYQVRRSEL